MKRGGRLNLYFAPILLITVAFIQIVRAHWLDQSPWKGGGFGMFSTVDSPGARFLRVTLVLPGADVPVDVPGALGGLARLARTVPSESNLERLAEALLAVTWVRQDYHLTYLPLPEKPSASSSSSGPALVRARLSSSTRLRSKDRREPEPEGDEAITPVAVRVELWQYAYDSGRSSLRASPRNTVQARKAPPAEVAGRE